MDLLKNSRENLAFESLKRPPLMLLKSYETNIMAEPLPIYTVKNNSSKIYEMQPGLRNATCNLGFSYLAIGNIQFSRKKVVQPKPGVELAPLM